MTYELGIGILAVIGAFVHFVNKASQLAKITDLTNLFNNNKTEVKSDKEELETKLYKLVETQEKRIAWLENERIESLQERLELTNDQDEQLKLNNKLKELLELISENTTKDIKEGE